LPTCNDAACDRLVKRLRHDTRDPGKVGVRGDLPHGCTDSWRAAYELLAMIVSLEAMVVRPVV
jgi:hypothetical protein